MIQNLTTLFKNLTFRSGVSLCGTVSRGKYCTLPPINDGDEKDLPIDNQEDLERKRIIPLKYDEDAFELRKFKEYPYYVEREWWKEGKRMTFWANWRQLRDVRRRKALAECGPDRIRYKALKENTILPQALRDEMAEILHNMNKDSRPNLILNMCMFTGRSRGKIKAFRVNRHIFRKLADSSKLSGVQRAMW